MEEEREKILQMIADGIISADDGQELLTALNGEEEGDDSAERSWTPPQEPDRELPNMNEYRARWRTLFNAGAGVFGVSSALFLLMGKRLGTIGKIMRLLLLPVMGISGLVALAAYWSRDGLWLLVRIFSAGRQDIEISLPLLFPVHWLRVAVGMAADKIVLPELSDQLGAAADLLNDIDEDRHDPFVVDVDDGDGNRVQVFIG
ncbi:MAG: hypothetical protein M9928_15810 [Anaerolineae bacterium]|nr:hypothetical protein [Anaerolineae bacterium]MCO5206502.1 hypothetical protein [Anaerolineae bacterium]